jgi:hypothetical protein
VRREHARGEGHNVPHGHHAAGAVPHGRSRAVGAQRTPALVRAEQRGRQSALGARNLRRTTRRSGSAGAVYLLCARCAAAERGLRPPRGRCRGTGGQPGCRQLHRPTRAAGAAAAARAARGAAAASWPRAAPPCRHRTQPSRAAPARPCTAIWPPPPALRRAHAVQGKEQLEPQRREPRTSHTGCTRPALQAAKRCLCRAAGQPAPSPRTRAAQLQQPRVHLGIQGTQALRQAARRRRGGLLRTASLGLVASGPIFPATLPNP